MIFEICLCLNNALSQDLLICIKPAVKQGADRFMLVSSVLLFRNG